MRTLIINFKNYPEVLGEGAVSLARAAERASRRISVELIVAPPQPSLGLVAAHTELQVFSQSVSDRGDGASTGSVVVEAVKAAGATGTLLNHSESPIAKGQLESLVPRLKAEGLKVCLCAKTARQAATLSRLGPEYIAVEPPELIGSGVAVSRARPQLLSDTVAKVRGAGYKGRILCGAGITNGSDVERAVELGVQGVLVASSVVKAKDWVTTISELARALV